MVSDSIQWVKMDEKARRSYLYSSPHSLIRLYENISYCRRLVSLTSCKEQLCVAQPCSARKIFAFLGPQEAYFGVFWGYFLKNFPEKSRGVNLNFSSRRGVRGVRPQVGGQTPQGSLGGGLRDFFSLGGGVKTYQNNPMPIYALNKAI